MKNWKGVLTILLMSVLSLGFSLSAFAAETDALQLKSKSAVLMDAGTGTILYEKNSHEAMPPASVTKVMTLLLIYEAEAAGQFGWEETVQVSEHAASMGGSQVFLEPGETQTAAELTKCIAIASANDAAVAMAEFVAGLCGADEQEGRGIGDAGNAFCQCLRTGCGRTRNQCV